MLRNEDFGTGLSRMDLKKPAYVKIREKFKSLSFTEESEDSEVLVFRKDGIKAKYLYFAGSATPIHIISLTHEIPDEVKVTGIRGVRREFVPGARDVDFVRRWPLVDKKNQREWKEYLKSDKEKPAVLTYGAHFNDYNVTLSVLLFRGAVEDATLTLTVTGRQ